LENTLFEKDVFEKSLAVVASVTGLQLQLSNNRPNLGPRVLILSPPLGVMRREPGYEVATDL
jgi:hypothetical protein